MTNTAAPLPHQPGAVYTPDPEATKLNEHPSLKDIIYGKPKDHALEGRGITSIASTNNGSVILFTFGDKKIHELKLHGAVGEHIRGLTGAKLVEIVNVALEIFKKGIDSTKQDTLKDKTIKRTHFDSQDVRIEGDAAELARANTDKDLFRTFQRLITGIDLVPVEDDDKDEDSPDPVSHPETKPVSTPEPKPVETDISPTPDPETPKEPAKKPETPTEEPTRPQLPPEKAPEPPPMTARQVGPTRTNPDEVPKDGAKTANFSRSKTHKKELDEPPESQKPAVPSPSPSPAQPAPAPTQQTHLQVPTSAGFRRPSLDGLGKDVNKNPKPATAPPGFDQLTKTADKIVGSKTPPKTAPQPGQPTPSSKTRNPSDTKQAKTKGSPSDVKPKAPTRPAPHAPSGGSVKKLAEKFEKLSEEQKP